MARFRALILLSLLISIADVAFASSKGTVTGRVVNQTTQQPVSGSIVRLSISRDDEVIAGAEGKTDAKGNYRFPNLDADSSLRYRIRAMVTGVPFEGPIASFSAGKTSLTIGDVLVLPVTGDPVKITAEEILVFEFGRSNLLKITHSIKLVNEGDVTYDPRADGGKPIEVSLPEGGSRLEFGAGLDAETARFDAASHRLMLQLQVRPGPTGERRIEFGYLYPYDSRSIPFNFTMSVNRNRFLVLLADQDLAVKSAQLSSEGEKTMGKHTYYIYGGGPFQSGEPSTFTLSGLSRDKDLPLQIMVLGVVAVLLGGAYLFFRRQKDMKSTTTLQDREETCFALLTELERKRRAGLVSDIEYREEREHFSEILLELRAGRPSNQTA